MTFFSITNQSPMSGVDEEAIPDIPTQWPRPCSPPSFPGEAASVEESARAKRAQLKGAALTMADCKILFQDREHSGLVVVCKPSGVYVDDVLRVVVDFEFGKGNDASSIHTTAQKITMLHRLDRDTSGCLAFATNKEANTFYAHAFRDGKCGKTYVGEICGGERSGAGDVKGNALPPRLTDLPRTVETGHGRSKHGLWRVYPARDVGRDLPSTTTKSNKVKRAHTVVQKIAHNRFAFITLKTGRTHQIRLHMAHIGAPLVGDVKYGGDEAAGGNGETTLGEVERISLTKETKPGGGVRLHAARLRLPRRDDGNKTDTVRGKRGVIDVIAPKPSWWDVGGDTEGVGGYEGEILSLREEEDDV